MSKEQKFPGSGKEFRIKFKSDCFAENDIITTSMVHSKELVVTKVYRLIWWKKILLWLGFKVKFYEVKVKEIDNENNK